MAEAKHAFVDDYPYLVYSHNAETTSEGGSGGGGTGFPVIEADADTGTLTVTAGELKEMLDTSPVILHISQGVNQNIMWITLLAYFISNDDGYIFVADKIDLETSGLILVKWKADTANDYPTPYQG